MMKTSRGVIIICLLTFAALSCDSACLELNSTNDLKEVFSNKSVPLHSLTLLHWFANKVDIDSNNVVHLSFDPQGDFGSQHYSNNEGFLPSDPQGSQYYTVGNVNPPSGNTDNCPVYQHFPEYVLYPRVIEPADSERNRDRIIVSAQGQKVGQIYLSQHFKQEEDQGSSFDPDHTFRISPSLLQQLRLFSFNDNSRSLQELRDQFDNNINDNQLNDLINIWGRDQAPLGLLYSIVVPQKNNLLGLCSENKRWSPDLLGKITGDRQNCEIKNMNVQVKTGVNGTAEIVWRNVPRDQLDGSVAVALFKNQKDQRKSLKFMTIQSSEGSYDTKIPVSEGLQARLHKIQCNLCVQSLREEICRGKEFKSPPAVPFTGYAQLQMFVRDGKACFRLYIKKSCSQWRSYFESAWIGMFSSAEKSSGEYSMYVWTKDMAQGPDSGEYSTFESCTSTTVSPGLQARIFYGGKEARTQVWR